MRNSGSAKSARWSAVSRSRTARSPHASAVACAPANPHAEALDQVHMIVHQAISPNGYPLPLGILPQQLQVDEAIVVGIENPPAVISALRDVVRQTYRNHTGNSWH
jgi:hypothetical protein